MRTLLITGGSRGIGRAIVKLFTSSGYKVAFTYNSSSEAAGSLEKETGALAIRADSSDEKDVIYAVEKARDFLGHIDCLINNAGISSFSLFTDIDLGEWQHLLSINLNGAFLYSREVSRDMISRHNGRIINISSMWGITGASCEVAYSTSKAAVNGMTKALAKELGPSGITVNTIAPGFIDTDMNSAISDEDKRSFCEETPIPRMGDAREVACAALFLAEESSGFITGDVINVSGGYVS